MPYNTEVRVGMTFTEFTIDTISKTVGGRENPNMNLSVFGFERRKWIGPGVY